jgi:hypothetical protein
LSPCRTLLCLLLSSSFLLRFPTPALPPSPSPPASLPPPSRSSPPAHLAGPPSVETGTA